MFITKKARRILHKCFVAPFRSKNREPASRPEPSPVVCVPMRRGSPIEGTAEIVPPLQRCISESSSDANSGSEVTLDLAKMRAFHNNDDLDEYLDSVVPEHKWVCQPSPKFDPKDFHCGSHDSYGAHDSGGHCDGSGGGGCDGCDGGFD